MNDIVYMQDVIDAVTRFFDKSYMEDADVHKQDLLYELSFVPSVNQLKRYRKKDIEQLPSAEPDRSLWFRIGEICVDESKGFISSGRAVEKIRELLKEERRKE